GTDDTFKENQKSQRNPKRQQHQKNRADQQTVLKRATTQMSWHSGNVAYICWWTGWNISLQTP
ncbi:hypothetical protein BM535_22030, partial [Clostridioides difficile]